MELGVDALPALEHQQVCLRIRDQARVVHPVPTRYPSRSAKSSS